MFNLALDCKLRACDFLKLKVRDIAHGTTVGTLAVSQFRVNAYFSSTK